MALTNNLTSYWKLDEASGDLIDSHGSNNGTNHGATYGATGKINDAMSFATNDYIVVGDFNFVTASDFSFSFWVKPTFITEYSRFFSSRPASLNQGYFCRITDADDGKVSFAGLGGTVTESTDTLTENVWNHVVITGDSGAIKIYINGGTPVSGTTTINSGDTDLHLGRDGVQTSYLTGSLDEFAIWSGKVLTASEVSELYNSGSGLAYPFSTGTNCKINIGDTFKDVSEMKINIGDTWKDVAEVKQNIGDTWKDVF